MFPHASELTTLPFVALIGFILYRRVRRSIGEQPVQPKRMLFRMVMLPLVCVAFLAAAPSAEATLAAAAGATAGVVLGFVALSRTHFHSTAAGRFYTPNPWIGLFVLALVLGRMAARLSTLSAAHAAPGAFQSPFGAAQRSPLTLALFFVMAGYYVCYFGGVLVRSRAAPVEPQLPPAA